MTIKELVPITMSEVEELAKGSEGEDKIKGFLKRFPHPKKERAMEIKKELEKLGNIKLREENIIKIIDFMPEDAADLIKILPGVSLDQEEINKILEILKK
jgi:DNA-directed RNA polymerase subunit F